MDYRNELKENNADLETIINLLNMIPDFDIPNLDYDRLESLFFTTTGGIVPEYEHGYASIALSGNIFKGSTSGTIIE